MSAVQSASTCVIQLTQPSAVQSAMARANFVANATVAQATPAVKSAKAQAKTAVKSATVHAVKTPSGVKGKLQSAVQSAKTPFGVRGKPQSAVQSAKQNKPKQTQPKPLTVWELVLAALCAAKPAPRGDIKKISKSSSLRRHITSSTHATLRRTVVFSTSTTQVVCVEPVKHRREVLLAPPVFQSTTVKLNKPSKSSVSYSRPALVKRTGGISTGNFLKAKLKCQKRSNFNFKNLELNLPVYKRPTPRSHFIEMKKMAKPLTLNADNALSTLLTHASTVSTVWNNAKLASNLLSIASGFTAVCRERNAWLKMLHISGLVHPLAHFSAYVKNTYYPDLDIQQVFNQIVSSLCATTTEVQTEEILTAIPSETLIQNSILELPGEVVSKIVAGIITGLLALGLMQSNSKLSITSMGNAIRGFRETQNGALDLAKFVTRDILGYTLSEEMPIVEECTEFIEQVTTLVETPRFEFILDKEKFQRLKGLSKRYTELSKRAKDSPVAKNLLRVYSSHLSSITDTIRSLTVILETKSRQEPLGVIITGAPGVGKSELSIHLSNVLKERLGYTPGVYTLSSDANDFYPPYAGQAVAVNNEFMNFTAEAEKKFLRTFNEMCSASPFVMQGATLETKDQTCQFKLLIMTTNTTNLQRMKNEMTQSAFEAFMSRCITVCLSDPLFQGRNGANDHRRKDFSHCKIEKLKANGDSLIPDLTDPSDPASAQVSYLEFERWLVGSLGVKELEYIERVKEHLPDDAEHIRNRQEVLKTIVNVEVAKFGKPRSYTERLIQNSGRDFFTVRVTGRLGSGKTTLVNRLADHLSLGFKLPINVVGDFSRYSSEPTIYIVDDKDIITEEFLNFTNKIHQNSIMLISTTQEVPITYSILESMKAAISLKRFTKAKRYAFSCPKLLDGLARRIGLQDAYQLDDGTYDSLPASQIHVTGNTSGVVMPISGTGMSCPEFFRYVFRNYVYFIKNSHASFSQVNSLDSCPDFKPDFYVKSPSFETLTTDLLPQNVTNTIMGFRSSKIQITSTALSSPLFKSNLEQWTSNTNSKFDRDRIENYARNFVKNVPECSFRAEIGRNIYCIHEHIFYSDEPTSDEPYLTETHIVYPNYSVPLAEIVESPSHHNFYDFAYLLLKKPKLERTRILEKIKDSRATSVGKTLAITVACFGAVVGIAALLCKVLKTSTIPLESNAGKSGMYDGEVTDHLLSMAKRTRVRFARYKQSGLTEREAIVHCQKDFDDMYAYGAQHGMDKDVVADTIMKGYITRNALMSENMSRQDLECQNDPVLVSFSELLFKNAVMVTGALGSCYGLMLKGNMGCTVAHMITDNSSALSVVKDGIVYQARIVSHDHTRDMTFFVIDNKQFPSAKDITRHILSHDYNGLAHYVKYGKSAHLLCPLNLKTLVDYPSDVLLGSHKQSKGIIGGTCFTTTSIGYCLQRGDCGLPVIACINNEPKIIGIHNAFSGLESFYGTRLFPEDSQFHQDQITLNAERDLPYAPKGPSTSKSKYDGVLDLTILGTQKLSDRLYSKPQANFVKIHEPDSVFPLENKPAPLSIDDVKDPSILPKDNQGNPDLLLKQLTYYTEKHEAPIDVKCFEETKNLVRTYWAQRVTPKDATFEEVLNGTQRTEGLCMSTSPGPSLRTHFKDTTKNNIFERNSQGVLVPRDTPQYKAVIEQYNYYVNNFEQSLVSEFYYMDVLKVELLPIEKIDKEAKVRIFCNGDVSANLFLRKKFLHAADQITARNARDCFAIGINFYSAGPMLFRRHRRPGFVTHESDFKRMDKTLQLWAFQLLTDCFCTGTPQQRSTLAAAMSMDLHLADGVLYVTERGNSSGAYTTTLVNCIGTMTEMTYSYVKAFVAYKGYYPSQQEYEEQCVMTILGDDGVLSVPTWLPLKPEDRVENAKALGLVITDPKVTQTGINFCSRTFIKSGSKYLCPLKLSSITKQLEYIRGKSLNLDQLVLNLNSVLIEGSQHTADTFEKLKGEVLRLIKKHRLEGQVTIHSQSEYRNILSSYYWQALDDSQSKDILQENNTLTRDQKLIMEASLLNTYCQKNQIMYDIKVERVTKESTRVALRFTGSPGGLSDGFKKVYVSTGPNKHVAIAQARTSAFKDLIQGAPCTELTLNSNPSVSLDMNRLENRVKTFYNPEMQSWPHPLDWHSNPLSLAKNGFVRVDQHSDSIRCTSCNVCIYALDELDTPLGMHKQFSPHCIYAEPEYCCSSRCCIKKPLSLDNWKVDCKRNKLDTKYCCYLKCLIIPSLQVDGQLVCGCWSYCTCVCKLNRNPFRRLFKLRLNADPSNKDMPIEPATIGFATQAQQRSDLPSHAHPQPTAQTPAMTSPGDDIMAAVEAVDTMTLNPVGAPNMTSVGAIGFDLKSLIYQEFIDSDQEIVVTDESAPGTILAQIPYGVGHQYVNRYIRHYASLHERYAGSLQYRVTVIGNPMFSGAVGVAWSPRRIVTPTAPVSLMMKYSYNAKGVTMPWNTVHILHDGRADRFFRFCDETLDDNTDMRPHLVIFLLMTIENPLREGVRTRLRIASKLSHAAEPNPFVFVNPVDETDNAAWGIATRSRTHFQGYSSNSIPLELIFPTSAEGEVYLVADGTCALPPQIVRKQTIGWANGGAPDSAVGEASSTCSASRIVFTNDPRAVSDLNYLMLGASATDFYDAIPTSADGFYLMPDSAPEEVSSITHNPGDRIVKAYTMKVIYNSSMSPSDLRSFTALSPVPLGARDFSVDDFRNMWTHIWYNHPTIRVLSFSRRAFLQTIEVEYEDERSLLVKHSNVFIITTHGYVSINLIINFGGLPNEALIPRGQPAFTHPGAGLPVYRYSQLVRSKQIHSNTYPTYIDNGLTEEPNDFGPDSSYPSTQYIDWGAYQTNNVVFRLGVDKPSFVNAVQAMLNRQPTYLGEKALESWCAYQSSFAPAGQQLQLRLSDVTTGQTLAYLRYDPSNRVLYTPTGSIPGLNFYGFKQLNPRNTYINFDGWFQPSMAFPSQPAGWVNRHATALTQNAMAALAIGGGLASGLGQGLSSLFAAKHQTKMQGAQHGHENAMLVKNHAHQTEMATMQHGFNLETQGNQFGHEINLQSNQHAWQAQQNDLSRAFMEMMQANTFGHQQEMMDKQHAQNVDMQRRHDLSRGLAANPWI